MIGPGKYDKLAEHCVLETDAEAVILIIVGGNKGHGMSASVKPGAQFEIAVRKIEMIANLPKVLRELADEIERDTKRGAPHA